MSSGRISTNLNAAAHTLLLSMAVVAAFGFVTLGRDDTHFLRPCGLGMRLGTYAPSPEFDGQRMHQSVSVPSVLAPSH